MSQRSTRAPASSSAAASALPIPDAPPVTSAVVPAKVIRQRTHTSLVGAGGLRADLPALGQGRRISAAWRVRPTAGGQPGPIPSPTPTCRLFRGDFGRGTFLRPDIVQASWT